MPFTKNNLNAKLNSMFKGNQVQLTEEDPLLLMRRAC